MTFLDKLAEHLVNRHAGEFEKLTVILPNIRAGLFLTEKITSRINKASWLPEIISSAKFSEKVSGLKSADEFILLSMLHQAYSTAEKRNIDFAAFLNWGTNVLSDFREIDQQLADPIKLFSELSDVRKMETWNPSGDEVSVYQKKYLDFSSSLSELYRVFAGIMEARGIAHAGYIERKSAEQIEKYGFEPDTKIIIAGFNALTRAESEIFSKLASRLPTEFFWDYDSYYLDNPFHEAGHFGRINREKTKTEFNWTTNDFAGSPKNLKIFKCTNSIEQAMQAGNILRNIPPEKISSTALVLADEKLLLPVLQYLPDQITAVNVTMGYPLTHSPFFGLFESILRLYQSVYLNPKKHRSGFYHRDVIRLIQEYGFKVMLDRNGLSSVGKLQQEISEKNMIYLSAGKLNEVFTGNGFPEFSNKAGIKEILNIIRQFILLLDKKLSEGSDMISRMHRSFLQNHAEVLVSVENLTSEIDFSEDYKTLIRIWKHYTELSKIQFSGEPLSGLQIMGLLETRNLDFENVIVLNVNEGVIPSGRSYGSMIPVDLRKKYKIPVHREKEAVFGYHFYRLIQRAVNVNLFYTTQTDEFGAGEMSRFILQLKKELPLSNPKHRISEVVVKSKLDFIRKVDKSVNKTDAVIDKLTEKSLNGFSPTALTTYLDCPLNFYYKYVVGLKESEKAEEKIEADVLGLVMHECLKELYMPLRNKILTPEHIIGLVKGFRVLISKKFEERFGKLYLEGKNKITFHMSVRFLERLFEQELVRVKNNTIELLEVEKSFTKTLMSEGREFKINGQIDRLERVNGLLHIIDYKTGKVDEKELITGEIEEAFSGEKNKMMQLLIYSWLTAGTEKEMLGGIYGFKSYSTGFFRLEIGKERNPVITVESLKSIEAGIGKILSEIFDINLKFTHSHDAKYCEYCS